MANGLNRFMNFLKLTDEDDEFDDDYYDEYDDYNEKKIEREERRLKKEQRREEKRSASPAESSYRAPDREQTSTKRHVSSSSSAGKVVHMPSAGESEMEVCIVKPSNIGEAQNVCELLLDKHPVIVNLEGIDLMEAQRIMDFIAGCIFAVSGNMCQVSRYIFMFSPQDVELSGDYIKSLETEETYNIATFDKEF